MILYTVYKNVKRGTVSMTIKRLVFAILNKLPIILAIAIACGIIGGYVNYRVLPEKYTAKATFYVGNSGATENTLTDIRISDLLVADYNKLAVSKRVKNKVAENIGLDSLNGYSITVSSSDDTRVMELKVTCENPELAAKVANEMVFVFSDTVQEIMDVENVNLVDEAIVPKSPSSPAKLKNTLICIVLGGLVSSGVVVLIEMLDNTIRTAEDIEENFGLPILAQVGRMSDISGDSSDDNEDDKKHDSKKEKK